MPRTLVIAGLVCLVVIGAIPSVAAASDFSGLAYLALGIIVGVSLACLIAGYVTTLLLIGRKSRGATFGGTLVFAIAWFVLGWFVMSAMGR